MSEWDEKSISAEETFFSDLADHARMQAEVLRLADRASPRMRAQNLATGCVQVKIRRADFTTFTRQKRFEPSTTDSRTIAKIAAELLAGVARRAAAREGAIVRRGRESPACRRPDGPVRRARPRARRSAAATALDATVDLIRERFGTLAVRRGSALPEARGAEEAGRGYVRGGARAAPGRQKRAAPASRPPLARRGAVVTTPKPVFSGLPPLLTPPKRRRPFNIGPATWPKTMYASFFGLNEKPFSITPDPRYLFLSERHAEALAHLVYGINEAGGFIQLTGEVGTGKTTVVRSLLAQAPKHAEIALILNPRMTPAEFLLAICEELGIGVPDGSEHSLKDLVDLLSRHLLNAHADGKRIVLVVDEAQNLSVEVLEQVRLLTNLETETQKLLQIILIGQPELRELLGRVELRQLAQRITGRYHLDPLSGDEAAAYVRHRLRVAGATREIFSNGALREIQRLSGGVPRLINIISDRALLGAFTEDRHLVERQRRAPRRGRGIRQDTSSRAGCPGPRDRRSPQWRLSSAVLFLPRLLATRSPPRQWLPTVAPPAARAGTTSTRPRPVVRAVRGRNRSRQRLQQAVRALGPALRRGQRRSLQPGACRPASSASRSAARWRSCGCSTGPPCSTSSTPRAARTSSCSPGSTRRHAQVDLGGAQREIGIGDLSRSWFGDYVLLWRPAARRLAAAGARRAQRARALAARQPAARQWPARRGARQRSLRRLAGDAGRGFPAQEPPGGGRHCRRADPGGARRRAQRRRPRRSCATAAGADMSFILDALKKSENDRQRQTAPALFEVKVAAPRRRFPIWAVGLAVLLGVNVRVPGSGCCLRDQPASPGSSGDAAPAARSTSRPPRPRRPAWSRFPRRPP